MDDHDFVIVRRYMQSEEIRARFLEFFKKRGHAIIPSASLVPDNDPSVLFTTAGMQPLIPFLMGEPHPAGKRLVNVQKCVRTQDIEEVGDNTHDTFFEMLGNWSLGDYFKKEAIEWSYELLTSKEEGFGLDPARLYITVFGGNEDVKEKDEETFNIWKSLGIPENHIYLMEGYSNWWSAGDSGPCGTDTEMFYDIVGGLNLSSKEEFMKADEAQTVVEVWNDVFMEYEKKDGEVVGSLKPKNVDTGAGLERLVMVMQKKDNIFDTDLFEGLMAKINELKKKDDIRAERIVADHIRTATFIIADGVTPSNTDRGYILRRLIRRAVRYADGLGIKTEELANLSKIVIEKYKEVYPGIKNQESRIKKEISQEEKNFRTTLVRGIREFEKRFEKGLNADDVFDLYQTYGFPFEMTKELAEERGGTVIDIESFHKKTKEHQELSRSGAEKKFKGGLADTSEMSVKYHTVTHLLHQALREVLGGHVLQKGSNITPERLRFDFLHPQKLTDEEKQKVEDLVNEKIKAALPVSHKDITLEEAKQKGALGLFEEKYEDTVRVYQIGNDDGRFSLELCGGPHVKNTSELGHFKITKEEAVAGGIRRIKAVLE